VNKKKLSKKKFTEILHFCSYTGTLNEIVEELFIKTNEFFKSKPVPLDLKKHGQNAKLYELSAFPKTTEEKSYASIVDVCIEKELNKLLAVCKMSIISANENIHSLWKFCSDNEFKINKISDKFDKIWGGLFLTNIKIPDLTILGHLFVQLVSKNPDVAILETAEFNTNKIIAQLKSEIIPQLETIEKTEVDTDKIITQIKMVDVAMGEVIALLETITRTKKTLNDTQLMAAEVTQLKIVKDTIDEVISLFNVSTPLSFQFKIAKVKMDNVMSILKTLNIGVIAQIKNWEINPFSGAVMMIIDETIGSHEEGICQVGFSKLIIESKFVKVGRNALSNVINIVMKMLVEEFK